jgi:hypothetical protein
MATHTFVSIIAADNDATFRTWGKAISDGLQAVGGIAKLSAGDSSGQIDWATVAKPLANTAAGYEMYAFADTLQATVPIYIKVEYGSGAGGNNVSIWVTVGFAHDGAGALTGTTTTRLQYTTQQNYAVTMYSTSYISAATNRLAFRLRNRPSGGVNFTWVLVVERTHAANGSDTNYGIIVCKSGGGAAVWYNYLISYTTGVISTEGPTNLSVLAPSVGHGSAGGTTAIYPLWAYGGPYLCPYGGIVFAFPGNITSGVPFSVTLLGSSKTFLPSTSTEDGGLTARASVTLIPCIRWD